MNGSFYEAASAQVSLNGFFFSQFSKKNVSHSSNEWNGISARVFFTFVETAIKQYEWKVIIEDPIQTNKSFFFAPSTIYWWHKQVDSM